MNMKDPYEKYEKIDSYVQGMEQSELRALTNAMGEFIDHHIGSKIQRYAFFTAYIELMTRDMED